MVTFAEQAQDSLSIKTFKDLCENAKDVSMREQYCKLFEQQKKAEAVIKEFEERKAPS